MARTKLRESIQELVPKDEVISDATLVFQQPVWLIPLLVVIWSGVVLFVVVLTQFSLGFAIAFGLIGLVKNLVARPLGVAGSQRRLYITGVSFWTGRAKTLDSEHPVNFPATRRGGLVNDRYGFDGGSFLAPRWHRGKLATLLSLQNL